MDLNYLRFWASPLVILSSTYFIVDHVRQFVGYLITSLILLLGHSIFLVSLIEFILISKKAHNILSFD